MGYTQIALENKIIDLYPELERNGISLSLEFDEGKNTWIVHFIKGKQRRYAFIDKKDADACMDGQVCIYLSFYI